MLSDTKLLELLLDDVWAALPPIKRETSIASISLADLGAVHGTWDPDTHELKINPTLLRHTPLQVMPLIDANGESPARIEPWVSRAFHTLAHEIFHGVTEKTARLEYQSMSGALNESYSDIFGALVSNFDEPDVSKWNWEMGEDLDGTGNPLRDLSRPSRFGQPEHMRDFLVASPPFDESNDNGHVHSNSGIHNLAAYRVIVAKDANGGFLFTPTSAAALFYLALTQQLTRRATFGDSRRAVALVARTLFRNDPEALRQARLDAIAAAFDSVGIAES